MTTQKPLVLRILVTLFYIGIIVVNALSVLLPLNNLTPQQVSDSYPNLFAPAGLTFSIWGVIYVLLAGFVLYQWGLFNRGSKINDEVWRQVRIWFIINAAANMGWLFAWHYKQIGLSVIIMLILLITLIRIVTLLTKQPLSTKDYIFVRLPFSVYFGWITIATIANITAWIVSLQLDFFQSHQVLWTIIILIVGLLLGSTVILKNHDIPYGLVMVWAYYGILVKHQSAEGWNNQYPEIKTTVIICIVAFLAVIVYQIWRSLRSNRQG